MAYRQEQNLQGKLELVIDGWEKGVSDSPYALQGQYATQNNSGLTDLRCVNTVSVPGEVSVAFSAVTDVFPTGTGNVLSADANADTISFDTFQPFNGQTIVFTGASLPTGISQATNYWVFASNSSTFKIADSYVNYLASTAVNITGTGTGTYTDLKMAQPKFIDQVSGNYLIDANGFAWERISTNTSSGFAWAYINNTTLTNANGNGISSYLGTFLFVFRNNKIDYMTISTHVWTYGWATLATAAGNNYVHQPIVNTTGAQILYIPDGNVLSKIVESGDSTNIANYTFTASVLLLPISETATCVAVLGTNLLVGGKANIVYQWDRTSTGYLPIYISESNTINIVTINTNAYIFAGFRGRIYICNGTQAQIFKKVPDHISGTIEPYFTWGGATANRNQLYFGVKCTTNASGAIAQYGGVWAIDLDTSALRLVMKLSYATYSGYATALYASTNSGVAGFALTIAWDSGASTYGVDITSSNPYTGGQALVVSDLIPVGSAIRPQTFEQVEYKLSRPLVSGESIQLLIGNSFNSYFNYISTGDLTSTGMTSLGTDSTVGHFSNYYSNKVQSNQWLIVAAVLTSTTSSPSYVRLREVRIR